MIPSYVVRDAIEDKLGPDVKSTVYVVFGRCGSAKTIDYEGVLLDCWIVCICMVKEDADKKCDELNKWCKDNKVHTSSQRRSLLSSGSVSQYQIDTGRITKKDGGSCPLDFGYKTSYYGTEYCCKEVLINI